MSMNNQIINRNNLYNLSEILLKEQLNIPSGWIEEVYYDKETQELSFSSPMTKNSWTDSDEKVGTIEGVDINDFEGFKEIDDEFVEVDDDYNEIDSSFKDKEYERYYTDSSIITRDDAVDRILDIDYDGVWFSDIEEEITNILDKKEEVAQHV